MGFVMSKGPGTDQILTRLRDIFDTNVGEAAIFAPMFDTRGQGKDSKTLMDCAIELGIMPTDLRHQFQWRKWLRWTFHRNKNNVHDRISDALYAALNRRDPLPVYCDWVEDQGEARVDIRFQPDKATLRTATRMFLTVYTQRADQIGTPKPARKGSVKQRKDGRTASRARVKKK